MREVLLPIGLASAIGSLPHHDVVEVVHFTMYRPPQQSPAHAPWQSTDHSSSSGLPADFMTANGGNLPNAPGCPAPIDSARS